jgi:hypothetical protein
LSKGQKKSKKAKKAKEAAGKAGSNTKPPTVMTADVTSYVEMQGALLQLLTKTTGEQLRTTQQQNAAKSLKPIHNITATSSILQIIATFQIIDSKLTAVTFLGAVELLYDVVASDRVQAAINDIITAGECDLATWRQLAAFCITEVCSVKASDTMTYLSKEALRPDSFVAAATTPEIYLNLVSRAFSQVRWLGQMLGEEILSPTDTAWIIDKHTDVWPPALFTTMQHKVAESMDFDEFLTAFKSLPTATKSACSSAWTGGRRVSPMAPMLMDAGPQTRQQRSEGEGIVKYAKQQQRSTSRNNNDR